MAGYQDNAQCVLDYLALFQALSAEEADAGLCRKRWEAVLTREQGSHGVQLAPPLLRQRFRLSERDFLLAMAALALEMDGGLRNSFRRSYGLSLPTIEYGLQLISPICPSGCRTLADLAGENALCGLLLTTAEPAAYPLERPLILCRTALAFLTGLSAAEIPACTLRIEDGTWLLPLHQESLEQVRAWYGQGAENALYLCAPAGSGRRTLLRRACGSVVELSLLELAEFSAPDQDHGLREAAALAVLLDAPVCALPDPGRKVFRALERLCRRYAVPLAVLTEDDNALEGAKEVVRLPPVLPAGRRREVWALLVPQAEPGAVPQGAMTIGAVRETEKRLGRLLRGARENHCVLLFDEADSLFGKRAAVSTGQDKYANLSTSYLLQEIEQYDGVAILSTNLLGNFDDAFLRRLHYIVRFSLPDAALREALWRQVLPEERCGEEFPYATLAQAELSPARILAAARGTAVAAMAAEREAADLGDVVKALRMELEKENKALPRELAGWAKKEAT